ncbi:hypothetical protein U0070_006120 [Myodes glareolus]|uniref:Uncharacterized protein n=1 Tax=Myodes glareolus TaxID=447135 RepID=A0AAW0H9A0_MYOGA
MHNASPRPVPREQEQMLGRCVKRLTNGRTTGMALLFLLGCVFFPLCFAGLCWGLQNQTNLQMERQEAVLVASK